MAKFRGYARNEFRLDIWCSFKTVRSVIVPYGRDWWFLVLQVETARIPNFQLLSERNIGYDRYWDLFAIRYTFLSGIFIARAFFCSRSISPTTTVHADNTSAANFLSHVSSSLGFFWTFVRASSCSFWAGRMTVSPNTYLQGYHDNDSV